jgi:hypothetical protein
VLAWSSCDQAKACGGAGAAGVLVGDEPDSVGVAAAVLLPLAVPTGVLPELPVGPPGLVSVVVLQAASSNRSDSSKNDIQRRECNEIVCGVHMISPLLWSNPISCLPCLTFG